MEKVLTDLIADGIKACERKAYKKAFKLFSKACEMGSADGYYRLGTMYDDGKGVEQDYYRAAELYMKACEMGSARACYLLGDMYEIGEGVEQDYETAAEYYLKAYELGDERGLSSYTELKEKGYIE
jgi:hypothetical protein